MQRRTLLLLLPLLLTACGTNPPTTIIPTVETPIVPPRALIQPRIGIALGGGAAKGFAHIGVIKILEAQSLAPVVVAGTSAGSVVGALYASGLNGFALQEQSFSLDEAQVRDLTITGGGLVKGEKLQDYVNQLLKNRPIEKLARPFAAVATNLDSGSRAAFTRGNTGQAVRASCSIPGVFQPVTISGKRYVDGGVVSPVPVDATRALGADIVIAVDISAKAQHGKPANGIASILNQTVTIMGQKLGEQESARADVVITPRVGLIGASDFDQKHVAILEGEKAALAAMPAIRAAIAKWQAIQK
ncbi:patatin-like phospholipase family protein [Chitinimonas sp. BJB300]|uniref:patatin-like phospholipase family protein n=1 Tax=Chitinimonas sp. BJB300 TaxID=1559339 RepID=UPI000C119693|nr:patatin-like phospholipase family protein [Chitinimonas sp. BJB300]PHV10133.1 Patatin [Chitinimonas sp. BJB300]TSJ90969.1 patatin-like phospholipase family protein [Chitinimonas sp. BJB300]